MNQAAARYVCSTCGLATSAGGACTRDGTELADASDDGLLGSEIAGYRVVKRIGRGGMGAVYRAIQPSIDAEVAIKVLASDLVGEAESTERFIAEARTANRVRHEGLVKVLALGVLPDGRPYQIMEHLTGVPLSDVIYDQGSLPLGTVCERLAEALRAIGAMHAAGIIHRDLKPANLFVTTAGYIKVLDFGIAKLAEARSSLTLTGHTIGTPGYMSPEQAEAMPLDARSDLYAMGVVLFEAIAQRRPFEGRVLEALANREAPPRLISITGVPAALDKIVQTAMAHDLDARYASAEDMAAALDAVAATLPASSFGALLAPGMRPSAPPTTAPAAEPGPTTPNRAPTPSTRPAVGTLPPAPTVKARSGREVSPRPAPDTAPASPTERRTLGRYEIEGTVGHGGEGMVMLGVDPKVGRKVALKLLRSDDPAKRERLVAEARAMARVNHPNVVTLYELGDDDGQLFLAMEYLEAIDLARWLADRPRPWREILAMFVEAGRGLAAAHAAGVIHRDFKPANVLLGKDGRPRVGDFGIAHTGGESDGGHGTIAYMPPEQFEGGTVDPRSDQFAFCASMWHALHGELPFAEPSTALASALAAQRGEFRPPKRAEVPETINLALRRGLAADPAERFATMELLLAALALPERRRRLPWIVAGATVVAIAIAVPLWITSRHTPVAEPVATPPPTLEQIRALEDPGARLRAIAALDPETRASAAARTIAGDAASLGFTRRIELAAPGTLLAFSSTERRIAVATAREVRVIEVGRDHARIADLVLALPPAALRQLFIDDATQRIRALVTDGIMEAPLAGGPWVYRTRCERTRRPDLVTTASWDIAFVLCREFGASRVRAFDGRVWTFGAPDQIEFAPYTHHAFVVDRDAGTLEVHELDAKPESATPWRRRTLPTEAIVALSDRHAVIAAGRTLQLWNPATDTTRGIAIAGSAARLAVSDGEAPEIAIQIAQRWQVLDIDPLVPNALRLLDLFAPGNERLEVEAAGTRLLATSPSNLEIRDLGLGMASRLEGSRELAVSNRSGTTLAVLDRRELRIWWPTPRRPVTLTGEEFRGQREAFVMREGRELRAYDLRSPTPTTPSRRAALPEGVRLLSFDAPEAYLVKGAERWLWRLDGEIESVGPHPGYLAGRGGKRFSVSTTINHFPDETPACGDATLLSIASAAPTAVMISDGTPFVCDLLTGAHTVMTRFIAQGQNAIWVLSDDGRRVYVKPETSKGVVLDTTTGKPLPLPPGTAELVPDPTWALLPAGSSRFVVLGSTGLHVVDADRLTQLGQPREFAAVDLSQDGQRLAGFGRGEIVLWDLSSTSPPQPRALGRAIESPALLVSVNVTPRYVLVHTSFGMIHREVVTLWPLEPPPESEVLAWLELVGS
ncbi:MAG: protein kinase [Myxococcales bacterium]|nr:protein kinase [Myxococcales bacterium]